jgi:hypothetical protein
MYVFCCLTPCHVLAAPVHEARIVQFSLVYRVFIDILERVNADKCNFGTGRVNKGFLFMQLLSIIVMNKALSNYSSIVNSISENKTRQSTCLKKPIANQISIGKAIITKFESIL